MSEQTVTSRDREEQVIDAVGAVPDVHLRMAFLLMLARAHAQYGDDLPGFALDFLERAVTRWASEPVHVQAVKFEHRDGSHEVIIIDCTCLCCGGQNSVEVYHQMYDQDGQPLITTTCRQDCDAYGATLSPAQHVREWKTKQYARHNLE